MKWRSDKPCTTAATVCRGLSDVRDDEHVLINSPTTEQKWTFVNRSKVLEHKCHDRKESFHTTKTIHCLARLAIVAQNETGQYLSLLQFENIFVYSRLPLRLCLFLYKAFLDAARYHDGPPHSEMLFFMHCKGCQHKGRNYLSHMTIRMKGCNVICQGTKSTPTLPYLVEHGRSDPNHASIPWHHLYFAIGQ